LALVLLLVKKRGSECFKIKIGYFEDDMAPKNDVNRRDKKLEGKYANYFAVGYNAHEFIFDFGQNYSKNDQAELHTRIITSPTSAKALFELLHQSIAEYKKAHGSIEDDLIHKEKL
jgi:hypothetical protein